MNRPHLHTHVARPGVQPGAAAHVPARQERTP